MTQLIRLELSKQSDGQVSVGLTITNQQNTKAVQAGQLPSPRDVLGAYQSWSLSYQSIQIGQRVITPDSIGDYDSVGSNGQSFQQTSPEVCKQKSRKFRQMFNDWLKSKDFVQVRESITQSLNQTKNSRFVICTDDRGLQKLPWTLWDLLANEYPSVEVSLSSKSYRLGQRLDFPKQGNKVKVLAVLGDSTGINIAEDKQFLDSLPQADVQFLPTPKRSEIKTHLWTQGWDILFFAGHSHSREGTGQLQLNKNDVLSLDVFQNTLKQMAKNGLTLAIFNSCDGLGLARTLAALDIPYIIVMREPVPDIVAQTFLRYFLESFTQGQSFHTSVGIARKRLEGEQDELPPFGDWMPVLWQNPLVAPPIWPESEHSRTQRVLRQFAKSTLVTVGVTAAVMSLRWFGLLQTAELAVYDQMLRWRPADDTDQQILIVKITEDELYNSYRSISDDNLERLLDIVYAAEPRIVGLDIVRDFSVEPEYERLKQYFADGEKLITLCKAATRPEEIEIEPAPEAHVDGIGFNNIPDDIDLVSRRYLLGMESQSGKCNTDLSFGTLLANAYLAADGHLINAIDTAAGVWTWGGQKIPLLNRHQGGYHQVDMRGDSILLNYRMYSDLSEPAFLEVTLTDILNNAVSPDLIRDRIVLIGTEADSIKDEFTTPLRESFGQQQKIRGVVYHAHAISQLIDIVLGQRPQLRPTPLGVDILLIVGWAGIGSLVVGLCQRPAWLLLGNGGLILGWYGISWIGLVSVGLWLPFVPCVVSLTSGSLLFYVFGRSSER